MCIPTELLRVFYPTCGLIGLLFVSIVLLQRQKRTQVEIDRNELKSFNHINNKTWN
jgi:uncharacterized membrane protein YkvI